MSCLETISKTAKVPYSFTGQFEVITFNEAGLLVVLHNILIILIVRSKKFWNLSHTHIYLSNYCLQFAGMKRFSDGNMGGPFKRSRMGPDDIEVRLLIPSKVSDFMCCIANWVHLSLNVILYSYT